MMAFMAMYILSTFTPPAVEPEHPHWNRPYASTSSDSRGHPELSTDPNPVVEV